MTENETFIEYIEKENKKSEDRIKINGSKARESYAKFKKAI